MELLKVTRKTLNLGYFGSWDDSKLTSIMVGIILGHMYLMALWASQKEDSTMQIFLDWAMTLTTYIYIVETGLRVSLAGGFSNYIYHPEAEFAFANSAALISNLTSVVAAIMYTTGSEPLNL